MVAYEARHAAPDDTLTDTPDAPYYARAEAQRERIRSVAPARGKRTFGKDGSSDASTFVPFCPPVWTPEPGVIVRVHTIDDRTILEYDTGAAVLVERVMSAGELDSILHLGHLPSYLKPRPPIQAAPAPKVERPPTKRESDIEGDMKLIRERTDKALRRPPNVKARVGDELV